MWRWRRKSCLIALVSLPFQASSNRINKVQIDLSNKDLQSRVSSIGAATEGLEPSDEDHRREADNKLSEFLGNLPPVAVLPSIKNMQKENEDNWCYLGSSKKRDLSLNSIQVYALAYRSWSYRVSCITTMSM